MTKKFTILLAISLVAIATLVGAPWRTNKDTVSAKDAGTVPAANDVQASNAPASTLAARGEAAERPGEEIGEIASKDYEIAFLDGSSMTFTLRPALDGLPNLSKVLADDYDRLDALATAGDTAAAAYLSDKLKYCFCQPFASDEELDDVITELQKTHEMEIDDCGPMTIRASEHHIHRYYRKGIAFCRGLTAEQKETHDQWTHVAAESGDMQATQRLSHVYHDKQAGRDYLRRSWEAGNYHAAGELAILYDVEGTEVDRDPLLRYAYSYLYAELMRADHAYIGYDRFELVDELLEGAVAKAEMLGATLTPHDTDNAQALAKALLANNPLCCRSRLPANMVTSIRRSAAQLEQNPE